MEYLTKFLKKTGASSLVSSIIFAIIGLVLIINPNAIIRIISLVFGLMFILVGGYKTINYFVNKGNYDLYNYDLAFGIIAIVLGLVTIIYCREITALFRILIGLWIIYSAVIRFSLSVKLKTLGTDAWKYSLILSIIMLICGLYVLFTTDIIVVAIGVVILVYAIIDIIESIIFLANIKDIES